MELRHLRYLVAVAEELHFGRAAIRLNISQPPLSQQIRQLEEELGVQLFLRTKREVRLTEAGKRIVEEAYQVLGQIDHFSAVAAQAGGGEIGQLSIGVPGSFNEILVKTLRLMAKKSPGVHIQLQHMSTGMQIEALRDRRIGVGFLNLPVQDTSLVLEVVQTDPLWVAMPKGHSMARYSQVPLNALEGQNMIFFPRRITPGLHDTITTMCRNAGFGLNVAHEVDSVVGALTLVSAELGLAFCTPGMRKIWPDLVFRPLKVDLRLEQAVAYRQDAQSPALEGFLTLLRQAVRKKTRD